MVKRERPISAEAVELAAVMKKYQISIREAARLLGSSTGTVFFWINGRHRPHAMWKDRIRKVISTIEREHSGAPSPALVRVYHLAVWPHLDSAERRGIVELFGDPDGSRKTLEAYQRLAEAKGITVEIPHANRRKSKKGESQ